jgi:hypothetical protein
MQEKAKKTMLDTEKRIDDERRQVIGKRQALEQDSRMAQERVGAEGTKRSGNAGRNF